MRTQLVIGAAVAALALPVAPEPEASLTDWRLALSGARAIRLRIACAPQADCDGTVALTPRGGTPASATLPLRVR